MPKWYCRLLWHLASPFGRLRLQQALLAWALFSAYVAAAVAQVDWKASEPGLALPPHTLPGRRVFRRRHCSCGIEGSHVAGRPLVSHRGPCVQLRQRLRHRPKGRLQACRGALYGAAAGRRRRWLCAGRTLAAGGHGQRCFAEAICLRRPACSLLPVKRSQLCVCATEELVESLLLTDC